MSKNVLMVSPSPHVHGSWSVPKIMYLVVVAMLPAMLVSFYFFGLGAIKVTFVSILSCLIFEYVFQKYLIKGPLTINDGSALITGILLAFNLPSNLPIWMIVIGALVAIGIGKYSFGGLGKNPFNPALVGRVFLLISFPIDMTNWPKPGEALSKLSDVVTGPTPLGIVKEGLSKGQNIDEIFTKIPSYYDQLIGNMGGSLGEVSALALIIGGLFLLFKKVITWHIPVSYIGSVVLFTGILWMIDPTKNADPLFHLITGGMMLGIFFMATDMVTSPMSTKGMLIFGAGCGFLTIVIRVFGAYPEGVSFAILIMNAFVPLINTATKPRRFGTKNNSIISEK